jgi:hydrogenase expression/formation protein HypC
MCIGIPMTVLQARPGFALAAGRGERREIETLLVGDVQPGDWLLVFIDGARERIDAARAAEVNATLDLLEAALGPSPGGLPADAGFTLPSAMSAEQLARMAGLPWPPAPTTTAATTAITTPIATKEPT